MIQKQKKKTWFWFSKYIRLKYAEDGMCECYTCGIKKPWKEMQAGHGIGGRSNSVLFNEEIVRPQCYGCNICQSGKLDEFGLKLREEIGNKYDQALKSKYDAKQYTEQELIDLEKFYKDKSHEIADEKGIDIKRKEGKKRNITPSMNSKIRAKMYPNQKSSKKILEKINYE